MSSSWSEMQLEIGTKRADLQIFVREQQSIDWRALLWEVEHGTAGLEEAKPAFHSIQEKLLEYARLSEKVTSIPALRRLSVEAKRFIDYQRQLTQEVPKSESPAGTRSNLIANFLGEAPDILYKLDELEPFFAPHRQPIAVDTSDLDASVQRAQTALQQLNNALAEWQTVSGEVALKTPVGEMVLANLPVPKEVQESLELHRKMSRWSAGLAIGLIALVFILSVGTSRETPPESLIALSVQLLPKVLLLAFAVVLGKVAFASWHNYLLLLHRQHVIGSFGSLSSGMTTTEMRNHLLLSVYHTIAAFQPTGFNKSPMEATIIPSPVREAIGTIDDSRS